MQAHVRKHLVQGLFLVAIATTARSTGLEIGALGLLLVVVLCLGLVEVGLRVIHRRDASRPMAVKATT